MADGAVVDRIGLRARLDAGLARLDEALAPLVPTPAAALALPGAALDERARERLLDFVALLEKWNRRYNLTAVRDPRAMIGRHLLDSLALLPWLPRASADARDVGRDRDGPDTDRPARRGARATDCERTVFDLIDVGSGAGLPVLPLAIARPDLACLSVEPNGRKARFQRQATIELGLDKVDVREARAEALDARARTLVSRAFAAPLEFLRVAAPLCVADATVLLMLGRAEALPEALPAPFQTLALVRLEVPGVDAARHLALCRAARAMGSPACMDYTRTS